jgi:hypothetical protein
MGAFEIMGSTGCVECTGDATTLRWVRARAGRIYVFGAPYTRNTVQKYAYVRMLIPYNRVNAYSFRIF